MNTAPHNEISSDALLAPLTERYIRVRRRTFDLCSPLSVEDHLLQCVPETSPAKWHLAHTTWFFETFVLEQSLGLPPIHSDYKGLYNSYYESVGTPFARNQRGNISRPSLEGILDFREAIDKKILTLLGSERTCTQDILGRIQLGLHHEEQHQELILMDLKRNLFINPMAPSYRDDLTPINNVARPLTWIEFKGGIHPIGHQEKHFAFDNEKPRHNVYAHDFKLASRHVTNGEWLQFINDGGYTNPLLWLADGWAWQQQNDINAPLYWNQSNDGWMRFCLSGQSDLELNAPLCHVSYYEADAYARWIGKRLPTEAEWEIAAQSQTIKGNFLDNGVLAPISSSVSTKSVTSLFGNVWDITSSSYSPYPGFKPLEDSLGEYNEKFMSNQIVLRGGSCLTPREHIRPTYRNFFYPHQRWAMQGIRLADS